MINFEIVQKQIIQACRNLDIMDKRNIKVFVEFFRWYYKRYYECFGIEHKRLTTQSIMTAVNNMCGFDEIIGYDDPLASLQELAEKYFTCEFSHGTDYAITHFSCPEILQNRIYECFLGK